MIIVGTVNIHGLKRARGAASEGTFRCPSCGCGSPCAGSSPVGSGSPADSNSPADSSFPAGSNSNSPADMSSPVEGGSSAMGSSSSGTGQVYRHKVVRRFLTLYFIPLIPLDVVAEYVECQHCGARFPAALPRADATELAAMEERRFQDELQRVLVLVMLADGTAEKAELSAIQEYLVECGGDRPDLDELAEQVRLAREANTTALDYITALAPRLSIKRKKLLVCGAFLVATATGRLKPPQELLMRQLPAAVGISEPEFQGLITQFTGG